MKKLPILLLVFTALQGGMTMAWAEQVLKGEVLLVEVSGGTEPASLVSVTLAGTGKATETDDLGQFGSIYCRSSSAPDFWQNPDLSGPEKNQTHNMAYLGSD
jgi:hypothetical protein